MSKADISSAAFIVFCRIIANIWHIYFPSQFTRIALCINRRHVLSHIYPTYLSHVIKRGLGINFIRDRGVSLRKPVIFRTKIRFDHG